MAPLGILTAITAAIRVGGPPWMKAVIGRARESDASLELELMSSTSPEVCEQWNGRGVVRIMGQPELQQIIYLKYVQDKERFKETYGLFTVGEAMADGFLGGKSIYCSTNTKNMWYECELI